MVHLRNINNTRNQKRYLELILPWPILALLLAFSYAKFVIAPYLGFDFSRGVIFEIVPSPTSGKIQIGDRLLRLGEIDMVAFDGDYRMDFLNHVHPGETLPLVLERDGEVLEVAWVVPEPDIRQISERIAGMWWVSYVFWIAGTATLLFIRPQDRRWALLVTFNYLTAIWLGAGSGPSHLHIWNSTYILAAAAWFSLPVYLHLHWVFPRSFSSLPRWVWILLYSLAGVLVLLELLGGFPPYTFYFGFALAALGSILLLGLRWVLQKETRRDLRFLGLAAGIILIPPAFTSLLDTLGFTASPYLLGGSALVLPALPGAYFLVTFRQQYPSLQPRINRIFRLYFSLVTAASVIIAALYILHTRGLSFDSNFGLGLSLAFIAVLSALTGFSPFLAVPALAGESILIGSGSGQIQIRANRILAQFLYLTLSFFFLFTIFLIFNNLASFPGSDLFFVITSAIFFGATTVYWLPAFQVFVDRSLLGIKVNPRDLLLHYAERITTSLDHQRLKSLLVEELLPALMIRQSILMQKTNSTWHPFLIFGLSESQVPPAEVIPLLLAYQGELIHTVPMELEAMDWLRVVIPLELGENRTGLWLFGRRDPDDFYTSDEIRLLEILANQLAVALTNIEQARLLHSLYTSSIDRQEEERKELARQLHDRVLGKIAALTISGTSKTPDGILNGYSEIADSIRNLITTLRPAMLNYGLWRALDELLDDLSDRVGDRCLLRLEVPKSEVRHDPMVEEHLYRIVQQACENAIQHAQPGTIRVSGALTPSQVILQVEDDGIGLPFKEHDLGMLISKRHFGLAGIYERAYLIGAKLHFESTPGQGTRLRLTYSPPSND